MLGLVETLVRRTLGSLRGPLGRRMVRKKLLNCVNCVVSARYPRIYKKYNRPSIESIQLPLPFLSSSFAYTRPIELGVGPLGS